jgi:hypothetical protein
MKFLKYQWLAICIMLSIILSSCSLSATPVPTQDMGAIQTEAFNQVLTQVALASTATPLPTNTTLPATPTLVAPPTFIVLDGSVSTATPFPFNTAEPGFGLTPLASPVPTIGGIVPTITTKNGCNAGELVKENMPDGTVLKRGQAYEKVWEFLNTGSCAWDEGYTFAFLPAYSTPDFKGYDILFRKEEDFTKPGEGISFIIKLNAANAPGEYTGSWKLKDDGGNYFGSMVWVKYVVK